MVKHLPTLGTLVSTKTKCIKLIFIGKITLAPVAFLMALSIYIIYILTYCERSRRKLALRSHCVLAMSMEFSIRPYHAYATTMVRPSHVREDGTTFFTGSVGAYHVNAQS